jgi:RND family efflux transporter MFP subunit
MNSFHLSCWRRFLHIGIGFFACLLFGCSHEDEEKAPEDAPRAPVMAEQAKEQSITETVELFGSIQPLPASSARITANVSAQVRSILQDANGKPLHEGQLIRRGEVVVQLDDRLMIEPKKQAENALEVASNDLIRKQKLRADPMTKSSVSDFELEQTKLAKEDAISKLKQIDEQLQYYKIRAPITGRLGRIQVQIGQAVSPGTPIVEITNLEDEVDALCFAPPNIVRKLHLHQSAALGTSGNEGPEGEIIFISPIAEADTSLFAVKVRFPNRAQFFWQREWRANTAVKVQVSTQSRSKTWVVPVDALMEDQEPPAVIVIEDLKTEKNKEGKEEKIGKAQILAAEVGLRDHEHVEILSLKTVEKKQPVAIEGAWFIVKGGHGLHDEDPVKLEVEEKEKEKD